MQRMRWIVPMVVCLWSLAACEDGNPAGELGDDHVPPATISDLAVDEVTDSTATVSWTAPGDDGDEGRAAQYDLRYDDAPISTPGQFLAATQVSVGFAPGAAGTRELVVVSGLEQKATYYFSIRALDDAGNASELSNIPSATLAAGEFLVEVNVADVDGNPVEGLVAKLHVPVQPSNTKTAALKRPKTTLQFDAGSAAHVDAVLYDLAEAPVRHLHSGPMETGRRALEFNAVDEQGELFKGTVILRFELTARDLVTNDIIFQDSVWTVLYNGNDVDQQPIVGVTSAEGRLVINDETLFPGLANLPTIPATDIDGNLAGTVTFSNDVTLRLEDGSGVWIEHQFTVEPGLNRLNLPWTNPSPPSTSSDVYVNEIVAERSGPLSSSEWKLYQNYPNPYN